MQKHVLRVLINAVSSRAMQFVITVTTRKQSYTQSARALCREQVPNAVTDHDRIMDIRPESLGCCKKEVWIGLGVNHLVARDHDRIGPSLQYLQRGLRAVHAPTGTDRPANTF